MNAENRMLSIFRGPMIGLLKNNKSVTLADGKVVSYMPDYLGLLMLKHTFYIKLNNL